MPWNWGLRWQAGLWRKDGGHKQLGTGNLNQANSIDPEIADGKREEVETEETT